MNKLGFWIASALVLLGLASSTMFVVDQRQFGVVYQLGEIKTVVTEPGLNFKLPPPFQNVSYIDRRLLTLESSDTEPMLTAEKQRVVAAHLAELRARDGSVERKGRRSRAGRQTPVRGLVRVPERGVLGSAAAAGLAPAAAAHEVMREDDDAHTAADGREEPPERGQHQEEDEESLAAATARRRRTHATPGHDVREGRGRVLQCVL